MSKNILYLNTMSKSTLRDLRVAKGVDIEYIAEHMGLVFEIEEYEVGK